MPSSLPFRVSVHWHFPLLASCSRLRRSFDIQPTPNTKASSHFPMYPGLHTAAIALACRIPVSCPTKIPGRIWRLGKAAVVQHGEGGARPRWQVTGVAVPIPAVVQSPRPHLQGGAWLIVVKGHNPSVCPHVRLLPGASLILGPPQFAQVAKEISKSLGLGEWSRGGELRRPELATITQNSSPTPSHRTVTQRTEFGGQDTIVICNL